MSPTFNSNTIFDSIDAGGNYSEGVLWVPEYSKIRQKIHFNGGDADRYLTHGYSDRAWVFKGLISAASIGDLYAIFSAIEDAIDEADDTDDTYHPLVDSFGNSFDLAQVHHLAITDIHKAMHNDGTTGYTAEVQVSGIIKGMQHDGTGE